MEFVLGVDSVTQTHLQGRNANVRKANVSISFFQMFLNGGCVYKQ